MSQRIVLVTATFLALSACTAEKNKAYRVPGRPVSTLPGGDPTVAGGNLNMVPGEEPGQPAMNPDGTPVAVGTPSLDPSQNPVVGGIVGEDTVVPRPSAALKDREGYCAVSLKNPEGGDPSKYETILSKNFKLKDMGVERRQAATLGSMTLSFDPTNFGLSWRKANKDMRHLTATQVSALGRANLGEAPTSITVKGMVSFPTHGERQVAEGTCGLRESSVEEARGRVSEDFKVKLACSGRLIVGADSIVYSTDAAGLPIVVEYKPQDTKITKRTLLESGDLLVQLQARGDRVMIVYLDRKKGFIRSVETLGHMLKADAQSKLGNAGGAHIRLSMERDPLAAAMNFAPVDVKCVKVAADAALPENIDYLNDR